MNIDHWEIHLGPASSAHLAEALTALKNIDKAGAWAGASQLCVQTLILLLQNIKYVEGDS